MNCAVPQDLTMPGFVVWFFGTMMNRRARLALLRDVRRVQAWERRRGNPLRAQAYRAYVGPALAHRPVLLDPRLDRVVICDGEEYLQHLDEKGDLQYSHGPRYVCPRCSNFRPAPGAFAFLPVDEHFDRTFARAILSEQPRVPSLLAGVDEMVRERIIDEQRVAHGLPPLERQ